MINFLGEAGDCTLLSRPSSVRRPHCCNRKLEDALNRLSAAREALAATESLLLSLTLRSLPRHRYCARRSQVRGQPFTPAEGLHAKWSCQGSAEAN